MTTVAVPGTGIIGSGMARSLLRAGHLDLYRMVAIDRGEPDPSAVVHVFDPVHH